jgi:hypothetical protein
MPAMGKARQEPPSGLAGWDKGELSSLRLVESSDHTTGGWSAWTDGEPRYFYAGHPWHDASEHRRVSEIWHRLLHNARTTGYGEPPHYPDLIPWLRAQGKPAAAGARAA